MEREMRSITQSPEAEKVKNPDISMTNFRFDNNKPITGKDLQALLELINEEYQSEDRIDSIDVQFNEEEQRFDTIIKANKGNVGSGVMESVYGL